MRLPSFFFPVLSVILSLVIIIGCWAGVTSLDLLRKEMEQMRGTLREMRESLALMPRGGAAVSSAEPGQAGRLSDAANAKYFDPAAESGDRILYAIQADSGNLNAVVSNDYTVSQYWGLTMDSLAAPDYADPNDYKGQLAESWSLSDDHLVWRIKLRRGVLWHDFTDPVTKKEWKNVEVTAEDFKFYLDVIKDEKVDAVPLRGYLSGIKEIRVLNDYEFEVIWDKPYFLSKDITLGLIPLPRHFYKPDGVFDGTAFNEDAERNKMIVGCGPYQFVRWENGRRVLFRRFEKYYGRSLGIMPPIREIGYEVIKHPGTRLQALKSKDIDMLNLQPEQWIGHTSGREFGENGFLDKVRYPAHAYSYIGLNLKNPLFQDRRVRQALSHLVDRERIIRDVFSGLTRSTSGPFFMDSPAYDKTIKPYEFSVAKAKGLLAEAGWRDTDGDGIADKDGEKFRFSILFPNSSTAYQKMLPILREDMAKAGILMESLSLEWSVVEERLNKRKFDACMIAWSTGTRPDPFQLWHSSTADLPFSSNFISFRNAEADRLIEEIRKEFDDGKRTELYHQFHRLIHEEAPYLFLFSPENLLAVSRRYRNRREFPDGIADRILWTPSAEQMRIPGL